MIGGARILRLIAEKKDTILLGVAFAVISVLVKKSLEASTP